METTPLKSFATWARTALIREVTARIAVVLAPASPERVEQPKALEALEKAVSAAGGGDKGKAAVADRVAYTWFNRIIALRFMDANGYTGVGVVSPQAGVETGQPEILAEAKRGNIDAAVAGGKTRETITALLNGTRRSDDAQGEAYALLLAGYCRYWNRTMPFMFERAGDFTELLIPANLLADDSMPSRAAKILTTDVCQDVEVIGWLYQFYISERKDEVFAGFKKNKKAGAGEIPAATQLFTPHWIVRYLVENSLGRLWLLNRPSSRLVDQMQYYIAPVDEETDFLKIGGPEDLKIIDPACGSGHMLTYAFDLLYAIYEEEGYAPAEIPWLILTNNLHGVEIDPRAGALAAFALTMKARAKQRTFFNKQIEPNVCVLEPIRFTPDEIDFLLTRGGDKHAELAFWNQFEHADTFGSLIRPDAELTARLRRHISQLDDGGDILLTDVLNWAERVVLQAEYLSPRYSVMVANPPYMGNKNMTALLSSWLGREYPNSKLDLMTAFMDRAPDLCLPGGIWALINLPSWLAQKSFAALRAALLREQTILSMLQLGRGVFGSDFGSVAFVVSTSMANERSRGVYRKLFDQNSSLRSNSVIESLFLRTDYNRFEVRQVEFLAIPGSPVLYAATAAERRALGSRPRVGEVLETREGLTTGDNDRFLRRWHEVSKSRISLPSESGKSPEVFRKSRWFMYIKGGSFRQWYGNFEFVVDWEDDGARARANIDAATGRVRSHNYNGDFAFREGLTWSGLSIGRFSARLVPPGHMFDAKGPMGFAADHDTLLFVLAVLNGRIADRYLGMLAPSLDFKIGHILSLPIPSDRSIRASLTGLAGQAIMLAKADWDSSELSFDFTGLGLPYDGTVADWVDTFTTARRERAIALVQIEDAIDSQIASAENLGALPVASAPTSETSSDREEWASAVVSYAVGCMFGRYSLDEPGLILADQGATVQDYLDKVLSPTFAPDKDNVIPIVDGALVRGRHRCALPHVPPCGVWEAALRGEPAPRHRVARAWTTSANTSSRRVLGRRRRSSTTITSSGTRSARSTGCSPAPRHRSAR